MDCLLNRHEKNTTLPAAAKYAYSGNSAPINYPHNYRSKRLGDFKLRIILSNIGTLGDSNPLIAIGLELKRRGHGPVMVLPPVYESRTRPLGLAFHPVRPDIDPTNTVLAEKVSAIHPG